MSHATWLVHLHRAMFENRVRYLGNGQFAGLSLVKGIYPRQLHLDF
jgi:hypothetical protein